MPELPFDTLQKLDLPLPEMLCSRLNFVHDSFLAFRYEVRPELPAGGRDLVVLVGKQDWQQKVCELGEYPGRVVLVFAQGDASVRDFSNRRGLPPNVIAAYVTNNELVDDRAVSVPLGIRTDNPRLLRFVRQNHGGAREGLLYGNFAQSDRRYRADEAGVPHVRSQLANQLRNTPWALMETSHEHRLDAENLIRYYSQIAGHKFVLSPEGQGVDCYRTWEALYLGAIPIVMVGPAMSAFADLPILFTEDYSELSEEYLERRWEEMSRRSYQISKMLSSYYRRRFVASVARLEDPRFVCWKADHSVSDKFVLGLQRSSLLGGSVVAETPVPPFVSCSDLMTVGGWHMPGALRLSQVEEGLKIFIEEGEHSIAEIPLKTIEGASFRLTAEVRPESDSALPLTVSLKERRDVIAAAKIGNGRNARLELDFVARSDRTVLVIRAPKAEKNASWLVRDLAVDAAV